MNQDFLDLSLAFIDRGRPYRRMLRSIERLQFWLRAVG